MNKIKTRYLVLAAFIWVVIGATGSIKIHLHHNENLTVGDLPVNIIGGGCTGPISWLFYWSLLDTVLIEQR